MNNRELKQILDRAERIRVIEALNPVEFIEYVHLHDLWESKRRV